MMQNIPPNKIEQQVCSLPLSERIFLMNRLQRSIELEMVVEPEEWRYGRVKILVDAICEVMDLPVMVWNSRISSFVWARTMVAYELYLEGFTETEIGGMLQKDHSTINHLKQKMEDALKYPNIFYDINAIWKQFKDKIK